MNDEMYYLQELMLRPSKDDASIPGLVDVAVRTYYPNLLLPVSRMHSPIPSFPNPYYSSQQPAMIIIGTSTDNNFTHW
jgi:hypothetical protein